VQRHLDTLLTEVDQDAGEGGLLLGLLAQPALAGPPPGGGLDPDLGGPALEPGADPLSEQAVHGREPAQQGPAAGVVVDGMIGAFGATGPLGSAAVVLHAHRTLRGGPKPFWKSGGTSGAPSRLAAP
jgi:hypothetical protein